MGKCNICIDTTNRKVKLDQKVMKVPSGVRVENDTRLEPNSTQIVHTTVDAETLVMTIPVQFKAEILVANSIARPEAKRIPMVVANLDHYGYLLERNLPHSKNI